MRSFIGRDFFNRLQQVRIWIQNFELLGSNPGISQCLYLKGTRSKMLDHKQDLPCPVCLEGSELKSYKLFYGTLFTSSSSAESKDVGSN